jgi:hypothetical protein
MRQTAVAIARDLLHYRRTLSRLFEMKSFGPRICSRYFERLLLSSSRIYLDFLIVRPFASEVNDSQVEREFSSKKRIAIETSVRDKFERRIPRLPWSKFDVEDEFVETTRLRNADDYRHQLSLHLPEIFVETFRTQALCRQAGKTGRFSVPLIVSLEHAAYHSSHVRFALERLSVEDRWGSAGAQLK